MQLSKKQKCNIKVEREREREREPLHLGDKLIGLECGINPEFLGSIYTIS